MPRLLFAEASKAPPDLQEGNEAAFSPVRGFRLPVTPPPASSLIPSEVSRCSFALLLLPLHPSLSSLLGSHGKSTFTPDAGESIG